MNDYQDYPTSGGHSGLETASVILGILGLLSCVILYFSLPLGALGILFALLSRGSRPHMSTRAKTGLGLSAAGLILTLTLTGTALYQNRDMFFSGKFQEQLKDYLEYYYQEQEPQDVEDLLDELFGNPGFSDLPKPDRTPLPYREPSPSSPNGAGTYPVL
jgi:hypothetical protein